MGMSHEPTSGTRVTLPVGVRPPFEVFVNGIPQREGVDYRVEDGVLHFERELRREKLSWWKWTRMFVGIAGVYGKNDVIDVVYDAGGQRTVVTLRPDRVADDD
jgi:hypothetical protein